jgi:hypothetical protein
MVGGNGSVKWTVETDNAQNIVSTPLPPHGHRHQGVDPSRGLPHGSKDDKFTVTIKTPKGMTGQDLVKSMTLTDTSVTFTLPIEPYNENQIRVTWGNVWSSV